jgi:hypothetical protein
MPTKQVNPQYRVHSLAGEHIPEAARCELFAQAAESGDPTFRALLQVLEDDLEETRAHACSLEALKEGTQPHWAGGADVLNGLLVRIALMTRPQSAS